jgi:hypothetical protein
MSERKYRQRGYMDDDRDSRSNRQPRRYENDSGRGRIEGAPRGRGVGMPGEAVFKCAVCGAKVAILSGIAADRHCDECGKPLHTCTNCTFFDPSSRFECRKPIEARVESKAKSNSCRFFQPKTVRDLRSTTPQTPADARAAFEALFKR